MSSSVSVFSAITYGIRIAPISFGEAVLVHNMLQHACQDKVIIPCCDLLSTRISAYHSLLQNLVYREDPAVH